MQIKDIMTTAPLSVNRETTIGEAAQLMKQHDIGSIPVVEQGSLIGIITDRDIVLRNVATGSSVTQTVQEIMSKNVTTVSPVTNVKEASKIMAQQQIRRLPVVDDNRLVGVVALGDLATTNLSMETSKALSEISLPKHS